MAVVGDDPHGYSMETGQLANGQYGASAHIRSIAASNLSSTPVTHQQQIILNAV
jgi:hypothetical protein